MAGVSKQRKILLNALRQTEEHPTAARLAELVAVEGDAASLSNLYRNLEILVAAGLVRRFRSEDGADRFDANLAPHYHVTCIRCHRIWDVPIREGDRCDLTMPEGFAPQSWEIIVRGTCAPCGRATHPFDRSFRR